MPTIWSITAPGRAQCEEIAHNVDLMARMAEQSSGTMTDAANDARHLDQLAVDLKEAAQQFRV